MGDTNETATEIPSEGKIGICDVPKSSIEILKKVEPSENIAIKKLNEEVKVEQSPQSEPSAKNEKTEESKDTKTDEKPAASVPKKDDEVKPERPEEANPKTERDEAQHKDKSALKNRSDIFSLNENKNMPSTIFSVGGAPSKAIYKTASSNSSASKDTIGSSTSRRSQLRNPLTGIGVSSNDEYRNKPTKRRDGNPLLGVGYKDDDEFFSPPTTQRIPPGGHSKGLW